MQPADSPVIFRQQLATLFEDTSLEVNEFLFWAERAQGNTYGQNEEETIAWYSNAMLIYDFLENKTGKPFMSRIYMRLNIISLYGYSDSKSLPYLNEIIAWILQDLSDDIEAVKAETGHWQQLPIDRIRSLRDLKMKLKIAHQLNENKIILNDQVNEYLSLINILP